MKKVMVYLAAVVALGLPVVMTGCTGDDAVKFKVADATGTISGKITDASTGAAIKDATVTLLVNDQKRETKTSSSSDADLVGKYSFSGVPAGTHTIKIVASGYATRLLSVTVQRTNDNSPVSVYANLALAKGYDQKVLVVDAITGKAIKGVTVMASNQNAPNLGPNGGNVGAGADAVAFGPGPWATNPVATGTTDDSGLATLAGLDQTVGYFIWTGLIYDANGKVKYTATTANAAGYAGSGNLGQTITIALAPVTRTTPISVVASNLSFFIQDPGGNGIISATFLGLGNAFNGAGLQDTTGGFPNLYLTSKTASLTAVFNLPIVLDPTNLTVTYQDVLKAGPASATNLFNTKTVAPASAATVTSENIVTLPAPTGGYTPLQTYRLQGGVTASVNAGVDQAQWNGFSFIVTDSTTAVTADPIIDNFNSSTNGTVNAGLNPGVGGGAGAPFLVFPEPVYGTVRVIGTQLANATSETTFNNAQVRINGMGNGQIGYAPYTDQTGATTAANNGNAGTSAGNVFGFSLAGVGGIPFAVADNTSTNTNKIHLYIDVIDTHGNAYKKELTLAVK